MQRRFTGYSVYKRRQQRGALAVQLLVLTVALIGGAGYFVSTKTETDTTVVASNSSQPQAIVPTKSNVDQTLELRAEDGSKTTARFSRKISDGRSSFAVVGELPKLLKGTSYEVWGLQRDPYKIMSLGAMVERTDGKYGLVFEATEDMRGYEEMFITLEKDKNDPAPGDKVLEGKF